MLWCFGLKRCEEFPRHFVNLVTLLSQRSSKCVVLAGDIDQNDAQSEIRKALEGGALIVQ